MQSNYQKYLRRRKLRKWIGVGIGVGLVFGSRIASEVKLFQAEPSEAPVIVASSPAEVETDWKKVLNEIDECRSEALISRDVLNLDKCLVINSAAYQRDAELIEYLISEEIQLSDFQPELLDVQYLARGLRAGTEIVQLAVKDRLPDYKLIRDGGEFVLRQGRAETDWTVWLELQTAGWRLSDVKRR
jgi:hypothetical protein